MSEQSCQCVGRVLSEGGHLNASTPSKNSDAADHNNRATKRYARGESEKSRTPRDLDSSQPDCIPERRGSATSRDFDAGQPHTDAKPSRKEEEKLGRDCCSDRLLRQTAIVASFCWRTLVTAK